MAAMQLQWSLPRLPRWLVALGIPTLFYAMRGVLSVLRMRWKARRIPLAPGGLPLFGQALQLATQNPWDLMSKWYKDAQGPVRFNVFNKQMVVVAEPAHLRSVWHTNLKAYSKDKEFTYGPFLPLLGTGLVTSEGEDWRQQRVVVSSVFRIEILDELVGMAKQAADRLCVKLEKHCLSGEPIDLEKEFRELTLQVIAEALLSLSPEESDRVFPELYLPIMGEAHRRVLRPWRAYIPSPEFFAFKRRVKALDVYIIRLLRERRAMREREVRETGQTATGRRMDTLDRMLDAIGEEWGPAVEEQLCYDFKTFLLAGHETSAAMLCWAVFECSRNPEVLEKVRAEAATIGLQREMSAERIAALDEAVRKNGALEYTVWVLKEALRKYSVVPVVVRTSMEDTTLGEFPIPKGTNVCLLIQETHNMEKYWPEPEAFRPERFAEPPQDQFQFCPFIQGPRNCLGQHLALLEARVVLAQLAVEYQFIPVNPDAGAKHAWVIPIGPKGGMPVRVERPTATSDGRA
eukprot:GGOE01000788.1.p1 GENE.GGOE01000788.1~~GGOE01000788.1.p1  ORF type:complete len:517 (+),score=177.43 GGOE01000788.1:30-1580(+)